MIIIMNCTIVYLNSLSPDYINNMIENKNIEQTETYFKLTTKT